MGSTEQRLGLRERKKIQTREAIRSAARQLVESNGYAKTTVELIADVAGISHATLFRYFPSKDSALLAKDLGLVAITALAQQPAGLPTAQALRRTFEVVRTTLSDDEWEFERSRWQLAFSIPELRELQHAEHRRTAASMAEVECRRLGRRPGDFEVQVFFAALVGAVLTALDQDNGRNMPDRLFQALDFVEAGMPVHRLQPKSACADRR
jgi:AcrR family transcriptional regulator